MEQAGRKYKEKEEEENVRDQPPPSNPQSKSKIYRREQEKPEAKDRQNNTS